MGTQPDTLIADPGNPQVWKRSRIDRSILMTRRGMRWMMICKAEAEAVILNVGRINSREIRKRRLKKIAPIT
jgi:hypothetical protein